MASSRRRNDAAGKLCSRACPVGIESRHQVALCPSCGSARYSNGRPQSARPCEDCGTDIEPEVFQDYITPAAFRTDFKAAETDLDTVGRMAVRTVATVQHEGSPVDAGDLRVRRGAGVTIMQLNDGADDDVGQPMRFTVRDAEDGHVRVPHMPSTQLLSSQAIDIAELTGSPTRWNDDPSSEQTFGLISKKETDALYLELMAFDPRLTLHRVARRGEFSHLPSRSAAISATQILVQKAALDLDVAPDEFEALEPRLRDGKPMLQIADSLINGSGLCRRLGQDRSDGTPHIVHLIRETIEDHKIGRWQTSSRTTLMAIMRPDARRPATGASSDTATAPITAYSTGGLVSPICERWPRRVFAAG